MPEEGDLEKKVETAAPKPAGEERSIFNRVGDSIDTLVKGIQGIPSVIKDTAYYTYYTIKATAALGTMYLLGGITLFTSASITAGGFVAGKLLGNIKNGETTTLKQLSNEATVGAILGGLLHYIFIGAHKLGNVILHSYGRAASIATKAGSALVSMPIFMTAHEYVNKALIAGYKIKPLKERKKEILNVVAYLGLPIMANFALIPECLSFVPPYDNIIVGAGISAAYGFLKAKPAKKEEKEEKAPVTQIPYGHALPEGV